MSSALSVVIDNENHLLRERPLATSRVVLVARDHLLSQLDVTALCDDLERVARVVNIARTAAYAAGQAHLAESITGLASQVTRLFDATGIAIAKFKAAADAVLEELPGNCDLVVQGDVDTAVFNFSSNDELAMELAMTSETLANALQAAAEKARGTVEQAMISRGGAETERRELLERMNKLQGQREATWAAHNAVLESLTDSSRIFDAVARRERRASRRARVYGIFSFISTIDSFLKSYLRFNLLSPITSVLNAIQQDAQHAQQESKMIMDSKRRQRKLNAETLYDLTVLSRRIREIKSDVDATMAAVESLHTVASECKRLSVVVMRMSAFWRQVHSSMGRLSSQEVTNLVRATITPRTPKYESLSPYNILSAYLSPPQPSDDFKAATRTSDEGACEELVVTSHPIAQEMALVVQEPCTALKCQLVQYYARWAALSDVCNECVFQVSASRAEAVAEFSTSLDEVTAVATFLGVDDSGSVLHGSSTAGPVNGSSGVEQAKRAVEQLALRLRAEVESIDKKCSKDLAPTSSSSNADKLVARSNASD
jgi:hypothetical protein